MTYKEMSSTLCHEQQQKHNGTISVFKVHCGI